MGGKLLVEGVVDKSFVRLTFPFYQINHDLIDKIEIYCKTRRFVYICVN